MKRELHNEHFKEGKLGDILYTPEKVEKNMPESVQILCI